MTLYASTALTCTHTHTHTQLGITTMTPSALLQGATSIVVQNKQLRNELRALEREIKNIRDQNNFMVSYKIFLGRGGGGVERISSLETFSHRKDGELVLIEIFRFCNVGDDVQTTQASHTKN